MHGTDVSALDGNVAQLIYKAVSVLVKLDLSICLVLRLTNSLAVVLTIQRIEWCLSNIAASIWYVS